MTNRIRNIIVPTWCFFLMTRKEEREARRRTHGQSEGAEATDVPYDNVLFVFFLFCVVRLICFFVVLFVFSLFVCI